MSRPAYRGPRPKQAGVNARELQEELYLYWSTKCKMLLHERNNLSRDDLEYVAQAASKLKDERLAQCVATLIGWGDDDRAELETFCAIALEAMRLSSPSRLREAATIVELRYHMKDLT